MRTFNIITGSKWIEKLCPALGLNPQLVRRMIIDLNGLDLAVIYVTMVAETEILEVLPPEVSPGEIVLREVQCDPTSS